MLGFDLNLYWGAATSMRHAGCEEKVASQGSCIWNAVDNRRWAFYRLELCVSQTSINGPSPPSPIHLSIYMVIEHCLSGGMQSVTQNPIRLPIYTLIAHLSKFDCIHIHSHEDAFVCGGASDSERHCCLAMVPTCRSQLSQSPQHRS